MSGLPPRLRRRLHAAWLRAATLEHASIASFARFTLQLLAVGAPPELVEGAQQAGLDEVRHARLCFGLAGHYGGAPVGPGPLPVHGDLLGELSLAAITAATVHEGCVGETLAAVEASAALAHAEAPAARAALEVIAEDEARHGALAWSVVRWALGQGDPAVEVAAREAFGRALVAWDISPPAPDPDDAVLLRHGRLSAARRHGVCVEALDAVIRPAIAATLP